MSRDVINNLQPRKVFLKDNSCYTKQVFSRDVLGSLLQCSSSRRRRGCNEGCSECNGARPDRIPPHPGTNPPLPPPPLPAHWAATGLLATHRTLAQRQLPGPQINKASQPKLPTGWNCSQSRSTDPLPWLNWATLSSNEVSIVRKATTHFQHIISLKQNKPSPWIEETTFCTWKEKSVPVSDILSFPFLLSKRRRKLLFRSPAFCPSLVHKSGPPSSVMWV